MLKKTLIANWKMNGNKELVHNFFQNLPLELQHSNLSNLDLIFAVPFPLLDLVAKVKRDNYKLAAQNCHEQDKGAYTGEVSLELLKEYAVQ